MATKDELVEFVREALMRGTTRGQVEDLLSRAGWSRDQITAALQGYAEVDFPIPVPRPKPYLSAREAFMYLLLFSTLYLSAFNLGVLVFYYINLAFPDAAQLYSEYARQGVRWALSSLIVSFPVFVYVSSIVGRSVRKDPGKRRSNVRRWLMYLTIFAAASVLIGDFITLVYNVLGGELTTRFVLKVLTIAVIAGTIFGYYLADLRLEDTQSIADDAAWRRSVAWFAVAAVVVVVGAGLFLAGAPSEERARRLDEKRLQELRDISYAANLYLDRHKRLPVSLAELAAEGGSGIRLQDPEGQSYEYRATGEKTYELCATFQRDSSEQGPRMAGDFWSHGPGRQCFQLERKESR